MGVERCVGGIVHDVAGRLLVIRRGHEPGRGLWSLPGGRVEPGETDAQAVVREMREETGLDVRPGPLVGTVVEAVPPQRLVRYWQESHWSRSIGSIGTK